MSTAPALPTPSVIESCTGLNLGEMVLAVRRNIDGIQFEGTANERVDPFWTDAQIRQWINQGYDHYLQMLALNYHGELTKTFVGDFVDGVAEYNLPEDMVKVERVQRNLDGFWVPLAFWASPTMEDDTGTAGGSGYRFLPRYRFRGEKILFSPTPVGTEKGAWRVTGISWPAKIGCGLTDALKDRARPTSQFVPPFHWLLVDFATMRALKRDERDTSAIERDIAKQEAVITQFIAQRSLAPLMVVPFGDESTGLGEYD